MGIAVGFILGSVVVGGYVAARPTATKKLAACVEADGTMHLKTPTNAKCPTGQKKVSWNVKGTKGATGAPGIAGAKGDTGDAVLDTVNCTDGQTIVRDGTDWACRTVAITGQLSITAVPPFFLICCDTHAVFNSYTPNVELTPCDDFICQISLSDVQDHQSCTVTAYGNSDSSRLSITQASKDFVQVNGIGMLYPGEPLYINLSCLM